jgi:dTMP kinase
VSASQGLFIVLEGVDGAGTTTQVAQLTAALRGRLPVRPTREPSAGPVGALLRLALTGRLVTPETRAPSWQVMALMFAADRLDHVECEIAPCLAGGALVISDRYYHSSVAYQSRSAGGDAAAIDWIRALNRHARRPDLTIVLDVPAQVAAQRRRERGGEELFDDDAFQARLCDFYAQLERYFPDEAIVHVAGDAPLERVSAEVLAHVEARVRQSGWAYGGG